MLTGGGGPIPPIRGLNAWPPVKGDAAPKGDAALVADAVAGLVEPVNPGRMVALANGAEGRLADTVLAGDEAPAADGLGIVATDIAGDGPVTRALRERTKDEVEEAEGWAGLESPIVLGATLLKLLALTTLPIGIIFVCFPELDFSIT